jgi:poly(3-hydroxybutyrate) depolymerase
VSCPPTIGPAPGQRLGTRLFESGNEMLLETTRGLAGYWASALRRGATPWSLMQDAVAFWGHATRRDTPQWHSPHEIVLDTPIARLRDFSAGSPDPVVPTLVLPPQAGHDSCIVDYSSEQSQMETIRAAGLTRLYTMDWIGATPATRNAGIEDYLEVVGRAVDRIGGPVNLIGDCQGGWLAAIYAATCPDRVHTLTLAGAPIDFHAGDAVIDGYVRMLDPRDDLSFYRAIVAAGGGVLKGELMLGGFLTIKPQNEVAKQLGLLARLDDADHVERYQAFEDWFKHTQDIPGAFYLWIVEHLFRDNQLVRGELDAGGTRVDLASVDCPLYLLAGEADHITPPPQVFALAEHASTPADQVVKRTTRGGHLGLFMGSEALRDHWPPLMADVYARSRRRRRRGSPLAARKPS